MKPSSKLLEEIAESITEARPAGFRDQGTTATARVIKASSQIGKGLSSPKCRGLKQALGAYFEGLYGTPDNPDLLDVLAALP